MNDKFEMLLLNYDILKFMRRIFLFALLLISKLIFAQDTATIKEINKLIGPEFKFSKDSVWDDDFYVVKENTEKFYAINSHKESNGELEYEKVFVFTKENNKLIIVDTSTKFERDGRGPHLTFSNDTLFIEHSYHHGFYTLCFKFNFRIRKYKLMTIETENVLHENKKENNVPTGTEIQSYDVSKQELVIKKFNDNDKLIKIRKIKKEFPRALIPDLAHFVDPIDENIYDKIWN